MFLLDLVSLYEDTTYFSSVCMVNHGLIALEHLIKKKKTEIKK